MFFMFSCRANLNKFSEARSLFLQLVYKGPYELHHTKDGLNWLWADAHSRYNKFFKDKIIYLHKIQLINIGPSKGGGGGGGGDQKTPQQLHNQMQERGRDRGGGGMKIARDLGKTLTLDE